jgi:outer membrane protease
MKKSTHLVIAVLIFGTFINNSFAQQTMIDLQGFWRSNTGNLIKIEGEKGVLVETTDELWRKYINKPIIENIKLRNDKWKVKELVRANERFLWVDITWELKKNRIIKELRYLTSEEENYYEKISDDLDYEMPVKDTATLTDYELVKTGRFDVTVGLGKLGGHTTYQIGGTFSTPSGTGEVHFPISELEFPLDVYMVSLGASVRFAEKLKLSVSVKKNITDDAGKMKDSDWGAYWLGGYGWAEQGTLDIYSESDADLDALIVNVNARYRIYRGFFMGLGYMHQNFDYEISNLDQWYPSSNYYFGVDSPHDRVSGTTLTYEVTYNIPYIEIGFMGKVSDTFTVEMSLGYSSIVDAEDEDHHLLRSKVYKTDYDQGDAILFSLEGRYRFATNWFLALQFDYTKIEAEGESAGYTNGVWSETIDQETESKQIFYSLNIVYAF